MPLSPVASEPSIRPLAPECVEDVSRTVRARHRAVQIGTAASAVGLDVGGGGKVGGQASEWRDGRGEEADQDAKGSERRSPVRDVIVALSTVRGSSSGQANLLCVAQKAPSAVLLADLTNDWKRKRPDASKNKSDMSFRRGATGEDEGWSRSCLCQRCSPATHTCCNLRGKPVPSEFDHRPPERVAAEASRPPT